MSIEREGLPGGDKGRSVGRSGNGSLSTAQAQAPNKHVLVVLASAEIDRTGSDALSALVHRDIGLTVVICATAGIEAITSLRDALDGVGVGDVRMLGSVGARMTDLAPRVYPASSNQAYSGAIDSLVAADPGEVAADLATVIAITGARSVILWDASDPETAPKTALESAHASDIAAAAAAARRAARVMSVPMFTRDSEWAGIDEEDAALEHLASVTIGRYHYRRDGAEADRHSFTWRDQSLGARIGAGIVALATGIATGALGTVTQAWTLPIDSIDVPVGLIGALVVTAALLTGLRLLFDTRAVALSASLGLLGTIAALSAESAGGSVLVPATLAGYGWVYGSAIIALLVIAWPRINRVRSDLPLAGGDRSVY